MSHTCTWGSTNNNNERTPLLMELVHHLVALNIIRTKAPALHYLEECLLQVSL